MGMLVLTFSGNLTEGAKVSLTVLAVLEYNFIFPVQGIFNVDINKITDVVCKIASDLQV